MRRWLVRPKLPHLRFYSSQKPSERYNYNNETSFTDVPEEEVLQYKRVTAAELANLDKPPTSVKMLTRDFIEDSLYNPHYGYFSKQAVIFSSSAQENGFDFGSVKSSRHFQGLIAERYKEYTDPKQSFGPGNQVWHTPTELFKPWYGQAIARCLVSEYLLKYFPYDDLIIYEVGAGNGTLALNILDFLAEEHPEVYERTQYHIVEISESLANLQRTRLQALQPCVKVLNESIFNWKSPEYAPCFVVALEVIDNFAHDAIRYELDSLKAYQTVVTISPSNDFSAIFEPISDSLISAYMHLRRSTNHPSLLPLYIRSPTLRALYRSVPFAPNLSKPEYIPTRLLTFLRVLREFFPRHKLLLSDFSSLPDTIEGYNAPVVQTRIRGEVVTTTTLDVRQGYFDIFFPTDFELLRDLYELVMSRLAPSDQSAKDSVTSPYLTRTSPLTPSVTSLELGSKFFFSKGRRMPLDGVLSGSGLPVGQRKSNVFTHKEFLETYAQLEKTQLRNGENPMLEYYKNVNFLF